MMKLYVMLVVLVLFAAVPAHGFTVELFGKSDCSPCESAREYLDYLDRFIPGMEIIDYNETFLGGSDFAYFNQTADDIGFSNTKVPVILIDSDYHIGYVGTDDEKARIKEMVLKGKNREQNLIEQEDEKTVPDEKVTLTLFWSETCPHCEAEKEFLDKISPKYPELEIKLYEVSSEDNLQRLLDASEELGFDTGSVPVTIIDGWHRIGYGTESVEGAQIENVIKLKIAELYENENLSDVPGNIDGVEEYNFKIDLPFIGVVDSRDMGVPMSTIVFGLVDGINPCAFFVLTMLLTFLVYARSRRRMLLIGGIFVFISGFVYFFAMAAMYGAMASLEQFAELTFIGGIIAIIIGLINVKDFFFFKKGVSLSVGDDKKSKLYRRMRDLLKKESMVAVVVSTIILAFVANSYELVCTAAIPFVYNNLLLSQNFDLSTALLYILLYNVFYVLPLLVIVLFFVWKLNVEKTSQERGEALKAISGFMMLGFGSFLLINPNVLSNIIVTSSLIGFSIIISWVLMKAKKRFKKKQTSENKEDIEKEKKDNKGDLDDKTKGKEK